MTKSQRRDYNLKEARTYKVINFESRNPLMDRVFVAYRYVGDLLMAGTLMDFAILHGLEDVNEQVFVEEHEDWLLALKEIMLDISRAVDFLARVTNRDLKIESGAVVIMGQGYVSRTAEVWNTNVSRRMLTVRPAKQMWWVDGESDEGEAERDPANTWITDKDMCDCLTGSLGCGYWRGCTGRTITEHRLRGGCHCANSYQCDVSSDPQGSRVLAGCQSLSCSS